MAKFAIQGVVPGASAPRSDVWWRIACAVGSLGPALAVMSGVVRDVNPPKWVMLAGAGSAALSAGGLAWRLGRFFPGWAIASGLVAGIPGLLLCTLEERERRKRAPVPKATAIPSGPPTPERPRAERPRAERAPANEPLDAVASIQFATDGPLSMFVSAFDRGARCLEIHDAVQQDGPTAWMPATETNGVEMVPGRGTPRSLLYGLQGAKALGVRPGGLLGVRVRGVLDPDTVLRVHALGSAGLAPEKLFEIPLLRFAKNVAEQLGHRVRGVSRVDGETTRTVPVRELLDYWTAMGDAEKLGGRWNALAAQLGTGAEQPVAVGFDVVLELEAAR